MSMQPYGSVPDSAPANDASHAPEDIRDQLRRDHQEALAELAALRSERDARRCESRLAKLRQAWMVHALAEETVVYRALEDIASSERADERFIEHELVGSLFDKLGRVKPGSLEWNARLNVVSRLIEAHIDTEHQELFARLERDFDEKRRKALGEQFRLAHDKLTLLERAKAA